MSVAISVSKVLQDEAKATAWVAFVVFCNLLYLREAQASRLIKRVWLSVVASVEQP
jgi:hypothetical protein